MKRLLLFLISSLLCQLVSSQCTPATVRETTSINTPNYTLNTAFNATPTASGIINNLSNGLFSFTGSVAGAATWTGGVQIQNDATVGDYIFVQPTNSPNVNNATYTFQFSEPVYNYSFRTAGLNNTDRVVITAFNNATPITITNANFSDFVNDPGNGGTIAITGGNTLTGNNTAGGTSVNTNRFTTTIAGPVTRIVIVSGKGSASTSTVTLGFTSFSFAKCVTVPPDLNTTFVNAPITGNVSTNDVKPAGTAYGTATALPGNPGPAVPTINADGTYTFTSAVAGVFRFTVPMCPPSVVVPDCPNVPLVITVTDGTTYTNKPFANIDRATTPINTAVTLNTLANDKAGNNAPVGLNPASVTVTVAPLHGTTSVNPANGNITFTPTAGYTGFDTLTYQVCDAASPTPNCATSRQIITIEPAGSANSTVASDDFNSTPLNTPVSSNVKNNDSDPQGNTQTVTAQTTTIPGKGTLVLNTSGAYTFTPVTGFSGPVIYPYQTCDDGTPPVCTNATLYLLVYPSFTLPLNLISFNAAANNANTRLIWQTDNQVDVDHFEIERSGVNSNGFTVVGTVPVNNNSSGTYSFTDLNARNYITKGYYRLKVVDRDGRFTYSRVVLVNFGTEIAIAIRPSFVRSGEPIVVLTGSSSATNVYTGTLYNQSGQVMETWKSAIGSNKQIETGNLSRGIYILKIVHETGMKTEKIVIQ